MNISGLTLDYLQFDPLYIILFFFKLLKNGKVARFEPPYLPFTFLPMLCEKLCIHYGTDHKVNVEIEGVHLDSIMPIRMGEHKAKIHGGPNLFASN